MKNRDNRYDRTASSQDFSNNEGFHNYQDFTDRSFRNTPHFADRQRSQYDDGMNRSERNDYRTDSDYRNQRPDYRSDYRAGNQGTQHRSGWNRPSLQNSDRYESQNHQYSPEHSIHGSDIPRNSNYGSNYGTGSYESNRFDSSRASTESNLAWQNPERRSGLHAGKGPKGYRRSDERVREEVSEALRMHSEIDASEIEVEVKEGFVTLSGTVESRQIKRLVEDTVEGISGVSDLKNDLRIMATSDSFSKNKLSQDSISGDSDSQSRSSKNNLAGRQSSSASTSSSKSVQ